MIIQYFAMLRDCTGVKEENCQLAASNLGVLLIELSRRYGPAFRKWVLTPEGDLCDLAIVLVNGRDARENGRLEMPLSPQDVVCIFPPVAGG